MDKDQQTTTYPQIQPHTRNKILKRILIGLGVVIISAAITVVLINFFHKPPVTVVKILSVPELITKYADEYKLDGYTKDASMFDSLISYKLSDTAYTVQVNSRDNVQFSKPSGSITQDISLATDNAKTFLTTYGFAAVSSQASTDQTQQLYDNNTSVCKIFNSFDPTKKASAYGLVCADKKLFVAERDTIQKLVALDTQTGGVNNFMDVARTTITEGNKALSMLSINPKDKSKAPYTLIFASIDDKWSYIGNRVTPSIDSKDSFKLSDTLNTAVNNPKYSGFLAKYIH